MADIRRLIELRNKTNLSSDEQQELNALEQHYNHVCFGFKAKPKKDYRKWQKKKIN